VVSCVSAYHNKQYEDMTSEILKRLFIAEFSIAEGPVT
jgi:hypothetical protein